MAGSLGMLSRSECTGSIIQVQETVANGAPSLAARPYVAASKISPTTACGSNACVIEHGNGTSKPVGCMSGVI